jgi:hypothetical protein
MKVNVKRVIGPNILEDATKDLILEVNAADLKAGVKKDPAHCVFANCAVRQLNADEALVFRTRAYIRFGKRWKRYIVSQSIQQELIVLDRGGMPEGGKFLLKAPPPSEQLGLPRGEKSSRIQKRKKQGPRVIFHQIKGIRAEASKGILLMERLGV